jgi:putative tricarboxylic transport membrane protein
MRGFGTKDAASGLVVFGIGVFFAWSGRSLVMMSEGQMGPGYFPMLLSGLMMLFGVLMLAGSLRRTEAAAFGPVPWRGIGFIATALCGFAVSVRPLGLGPALGIAVFLTTLASRRWRPLPSLLLTAGMVLCCWAVFIRGLKLPVAFLGAWFR